MIRLFEALVIFFLTFGSPDDLASSIAGDCNHDKNCYANELAELTRLHGHEFAFKVLYSLQEIDGQARSCHDIGHAIGSAAYGRDPSAWKELLGSVGAQCNYGALHAIVERRSLQGDQIDLSACEGAPIGCYHALGHVIMVDNPLNSSLDICRSFGQENFTKSCLTGALMEFISPTILSEHGGRAFSLEALAETCNSLEGQAKVICWAELSIPAFSSFPSIEGVLDFCRSAPGPQEVLECEILAAEYYFLHISMDANSALRVCSILEDENYQQYCFVTFVRYAQLSREEVAGFCAKIPRRFRQKCLDEF